MSFREVIEKYGYPCIGKMAANTISSAKNGGPAAIQAMEEDGSFGYRRYKYMLDAPFKVSARCCDVMKKRPAKQYYKETGRVPIIGTRIEESKIREQAFLEGGDIRMSHDIPISAPLSIWNEKDITNYVALNNLPLSDCYTKLGYDRTGCMFCMFGITQDRNRFLRLKATHPNVWAYCMKPFEDGGLGMKPVLEYMDIPTGCGQANLDDFEVEE